MKSKSIIIGIEALTLNPSDIRRLHSDDVMGVILFSRNYESVQQLTALCQSIKQVRSDLSITVDQEGGRVQRFREGFTQLPPLEYFGDLYLSSPQKAVAEAKASAKVMSHELKSVGVDLSFAPVVDLAINRQVIGDRAFSNHPDIVIELARAYIEGMAENDMHAVLKHFPGHGSVSGDTHTDFIFDHRPMSQIESTDLKPFAALAEVAHGVMVSHVVYPDVCDKPASLSSFWIQNILREKIGFKGVVYSDDLGMQGAKLPENRKHPACLALDSGCDVVLLCNEFGEIDKIVRQ